MNRSSARRRPLLRWIALSIPWLIIALLLVVLEVSLRIAGVGASTCFYREVEITGVTEIQDNRRCTEAWFGPALARKPVPFRLAKEKATGTVRIFVVGSSAAMGDPEPSFSLARVLEVMLREAHPELRFEVVNAAITAINSHLVRDIASDCAELSPDFFIVYEGNNEVIGPFGPAGVLAPFLSSEWAVTGARTLKHFRTTQALSRALGKSNGKSLPSEWGGMEMFLGQKIAANDPRLDAVRAHFRENLRAISASGRAAGAEVLLCTVATNERDFAPFLSLSSLKEGSRQRAEFDAMLTSAKIHLKEGRSAEAEFALKKVQQLDPDFAEAAFLLGRVFLASGRDAEARTWLARARDLDALRFRTDSTLNTVIRSVATDPASGARLVDVAEGLAARSPHGIVGDEFMLEHVHFTLRGVYSAALELWPVLEERLRQRGHLHSPAVMPPSYDAVRLALGYTIQEQAMISASILQRINRPPFDAQADRASRAEALTRRLDAASTLLSRPEADEALRQSYRLALERSPEDWVLLRNFGSMLVSRGHASEALAPLRKAHAQMPTDIDVLVALAKALKVTGPASEHATVLRKARTLEPNYPGLD